MQRGLSNLFRWALLTLFILSPCAAYSQVPPPTPDPILSAAAKAEQEGRLADAEKILVDAIQQIEKDEPESPRLSNCLNRLAFLLERKQKYSEAIALLQRAVEIDRKSYGPDSGRVLTDLSNQAAFYDRIGNKEEAEQTYKQALELARQNPKPDPRSTILLLYNLASLYARQRHWEEAEPFILEGTKLCESAPRAQPGPCRSLPYLLKDVYRHTGKSAEVDDMVSEAARQAESSGKSTGEVVSNLNNLGQKYELEKDYSAAEYLYNRAIAWIEKKEGPDSPYYLPLELDRLAKVLEMQGQEVQAEKVYLRGIDLELNAASSKHPDLASDFVAIGLMNLYRSQSRIGQIEPILARILDIEEKLLGPRHTRFAKTLLMLANVYTEQEKYWQAGPLYERVLGIEEANLGPDHPQLIGALSYYASYLRKTKEDEKAAAVEMRIDALKKKQPSQNPPN